MDIVNNAIQLEGENVPLVNSNIYDNSSELNSTKRKLSTDITDILKDSKIPNLETENVELILNGVDDKVIYTIYNYFLCISLYFYLQIFFLKKECIILNYYHIVR